MPFDVLPLSGYQDPYGLLAAILQDSTREWRWECEQDLGPEATSWQPRPGGHSIGGIFFHMIRAEVWWFEIVALGREWDPAERKFLMADETNVDEGNWPVPPAEPISWYFELLDKYRARTLEAVKDWPAPETIRETHGHQFTLRWIFGHVIQHDSYHGGQIVLLSDLFRKRG